MDFKKPERPAEDLDRRFEGSDGTDGVIPKPQPEPVVKTRSSKGLKFLAGLLAILLLAAVGYATYSYMNEQTLRSDLDSVKSELSTLKDGKDSVVARAAAAEDAAKQNTDLSDKAQQERVTRATSDFYCLVKDFGCSKVSSVITKFQAYKAAQGATVAQDGFAIVTATPATNGTGSKFYLKSTDGLTWVVIYDGQNAPSTEIADKFQIPAAFR
jgi:hypothetical protein